ncbi:MAG: helix-turn-helix domain containing protein, partial [Clostridium sp.]|nr:helix-turn-helix domain containing protein [Clostridium sp.]
MFDRQGIYERFASSYGATHSSQLAKIHNVARQTANSWKQRLNPIPWEYLKLLVDEQGLSWDWLIDGKEPKHRKRRKGEIIQPLDRHAINQRFLSLFSNMSQAKIGEELGGINPGTVYKWRHDIAQVPWERLKYAVDNKGVTWEWLIE